MARNPAVRRESTESKHELTLRIVVRDPPRGVRFQLQRGRTELDRPSRTTSQALIFEFPVRVAQRPGGQPNFLGPYAQGPPAGRFVYVNAGTLAGQSDTHWSRRAKVPLMEISWPQIEAARRRPGAVLEASIAGTGRDGGPCCASVPLLAAGWRVV